MSYICEFCHKEFQRESSITVHMCEPKRRRLEQHERGVQLGLQAYLRFYETMQGSSRLKTFEDFVESPYYRAFVKFGRYCVNTRAINPARFMEWLIRNNKKIDHWCRDSMYTEYLIAYLKSESVTDALERSIARSVAWAEETGHPACDMLRYGATNAVCYDITAGRISPWALYNSESGQKFLANLIPEQIAMIYPYINPEVWNRKFCDFMADQEFAKDMLSKAGW